MKVHLNAMTAAGLTVIALGISTPAAAQMYRWVDKDGVSHYSDSKPPDQKKVESIDVRPNPSSNPSSAQPKSASQLEIEFRQRQLMREEQKAKEEKQQRDRERAVAACGNARGRLADLEKARRIYTYDDKGNRVYYKDADHESVLQEARDRVNQACS